MRELTATELLEQCREIIDSYRPEVCPEEYIKLNIEDTDLHADEKFFLIEIFSGIIQYSKVLDELLKLIYGGKGRNLLQNDRSILLILSYLLVIRFEELSKSPKLMELLEVVENRRTMILLDVLIDEKEKRKLNKKWQSIYDSKYVDNLLMDPLRQNRNELISIRDRLDTKSSNVGAFVKQAPTVPREFNLKKKQPIISPEPEILEKQLPPNPIPKTTYEIPENLDPTKIRDREHERQTRVANMINAADMEAFDCAATDKSNKTLERMQQIRKDESRKLDFNKKHATKLPIKIIKKAPKIKMTTAALLREEKLYAKREEQSLQELEKLLQGARDDSDFNRWRDKIKHEEQEEQITKQFENILSGQLSREEAVLAKQREIDQKREDAEELKRESEKLLRQKEISEAKEAAITRKKNQEIAEADRNASLAKVNVEKEKRNLVAELQREKEEIFKEKEMEEQVELERKKALIREIRILETERIEDRNFRLPVDLTSTAGHALLGEMSIAEIRERLALLKEKQQENEEAKRQEIADTKKRQDLRLEEAQQKIDAHRSLNLRSNQMSEKPNLKKMIKPTIKNDRLRELEAKLKERRSERMKFQKDSKISTSPSPDMKII